MTHRRNPLTAVNESLNKIGIEVLFRTGISDWEVKLDTTEHDKQIRAEVIDDFVKAFNEFMNANGRCGFYEECYDSPTGDCIDCFKEKWLEEQNEQNSIKESLKPRGCADMPKNIVCNCTKEQKGE